MIVFAAFRLTTNLNLVGCSIGNSPGLAPRNTLTTIGRVAGKYRQNADHRRADHLLRPFWRLIYAGNLASAARAMMKRRFKCNIGDDKILSAAAPDCGHRLLPAPDHSRLRHERPAVLFRECADASRALRCSRLATLEFASAAMRLAPGTASIDVLSLTVKIGRHRLMRWHCGRALTLHITATISRYDNIGMDSWLSGRRAMTYSTHNGMVQLEYQRHTWGPAHYSR